ncbi:hypothetical protein EVAR_94571_1 [Eumeta japonica]|uniref:Uncharacterized protein n=1 Tax=Eumeta variegata TaxID=151549 RepID=A0A4C1UVJ6_EUMVA|nr:hypothetical protein EVAR_94571_1 [Eumeta japonica]
MTDPPAVISGRKVCNVAECVSPAPALQAPGPPSTGGRRALEEHDSDGGGRRGDNFELKVRDAAGGGRRRGGGGAHLRGRWLFCLTL